MYFLATPKIFSLKEITITLSILFCLHSSYTYSQNDITDSDKFTTKLAEEKFTNKDYAGALELYNLLYEKSPENIFYNYKVGICTFFIKENKALGIRYLEYAVKNFNPDVISDDVFFHLGKAYMLTYQFDKAINQFNSYKTFADQKRDQKNEVSHLIEMCLNAKSVNEQKSDWEIVKKITIPRDSVLSEYNSLGIGGNIRYSLSYSYVKNVDNNSSSKKGISAKTGLKPQNDFYNTELDYLHKDDLDQPTIYITKDNKEIFLSSYGAVEGYGKDLYIIKKVFEDQWSEAHAFPSNINTIYDENYPFLSADGNTLYFSSDGHNSMGGYDIFKVDYNRLTETWGSPINMGTPFNSPADDIMFSSDDKGENLFFASDRNSAFGEITIYRLNRSRKSIGSGTQNQYQSGNIPSQEIAQQQLQSGNVVQGNGQQQSNNLNNNASLQKSRQGSSLQMIPVKGVFKNPTDKNSIMVVDLKSNKIIGTFKPDLKSGEYVMSLAKGRKYLFQIKSDKKKSEDKILEIPSDFKGDTLRQEISSDGETVLLKSEHLVSTLPQLRELYYSVQIGSFSKLVTDTTLFLDIKPFYYKVSLDNTIKYYIGVYNNLEYALLAKEKVKELGIKECFIVSYFNSERIDIDKAKEYEKENKHSKSDLRDMNVLPYTDNRNEYDR